MRLLIIGGDGMLGHQLFNSLRPQHDVKVTLRLSSGAYSLFPQYSRDNAHFEIDARNHILLRTVIERERPDVVINAVGIVKQRVDAKEAILDLETNSLLPHRIAEIASSIGTRVIHFSSDCVFSGQKGNYSETDLADATDLYGRTKLLGEIGDNGCITLRTSMIGLELKRNLGLVEWFLAQRGNIRGFTRAIFSGFTTLEMARIVDLVLRAKHVHGIYHVSSDPISKYFLLTKIRDRLGLELNIDPYTDFDCDRSLDSTVFRRTFSYQPPTWDSMIEELCHQIREVKKL